MDTGIDVVGNITASGNISASGNVFANAFQSNGHNIGFANAGLQINLGFENNTPILIGKNANPTFFHGNITASRNISAVGNISASGNILGNNFTQVVEELAANGTDQSAAPSPVSIYSGIIVVNNNNSNKGVKLLASAQYNYGTMITVHNRGTATVKVYPRENDRIHPLADNTPVVLAVNGTLTLISYDETGYRGFVGTPIS